MTRLPRGCAVGAIAAICVAWPVFERFAGMEAPPRVPGAAFAQQAPLPGMNFDVYAAGCLKEIEKHGEIKFPKLLQCSDGSVLPITYDAKPIPADTASDSKHFTDKTTCDRPPLLDISEGGIGQCVPNSRLQVRKVEQAGVDEKNWPSYALLCRNYEYRSLEQLNLKPEYDDVAMIVYSPLNEQTCFFQRFGDTKRYFEPIVASAFDGLGVIPGANIPSPFEPEGEKFWGEPEVVKDVNCAGCHDANPFMRTPYVFQVTETAEPLPPRKSKQAYGIVHLDYFGDEWKKFHAFFDLDPRKLTEAGACVMCHSLGPGRTSGAFTEWSTGTLAPGQHDTKAFRDTHWMPPSANDTTWDANYRASIKALLRCHASPTDTGCNKTDLH